MWRVNVDVVLGTWKVQVRISRGGVTNMIDRFECSAVGHGGVRKTCGGSRKIWML